MATASGFGDVSVELRNSSLARSSYITFGVDPVDTNPVTVAQAIIAAFTGANTLQGLIDSSVTVGTVRVALGTDGGEDVVGEAVGGMTGSTALTSVPPNVALLVRKQTARGGRRGRGRLYIPWALNTVAVDEAGVINGATLTAAQTKINNMLTNLNTNGVPMVLLHNPGLTTPGAPNVVTSLVCDVRVATQRRRLGR